MASLLSELVDKFTGSGFDHTEHRDSYESRQPPPPNCPYPWRAHWDDREHRYYFINSETNEIIWDIEEVKRRAGCYETSYTDANTSYHREEAGIHEGGHQSYPVVGEAEKHGSDRGLAYGALGVVGGVAAGAGLIYAGDKISERSTSSPQTRKSLTLIFR